MTRCARKKFCACVTCRADAAITPPGKRRGVPFLTRTEKRRARAGYQPTHRKAVQ